MKTSIKNVVVIACMIMLSTVSYAQNRPGIGNNDNPTNDPTAPTPAFSLKPVSIQALQVGVAITSINLVDSIVDDLNLSPYTFSAVELPDGITIAANGVISGTPTAYDADGGTATITVANKNNTTRNATLTYGIIAKGSNSISFNPPANLSTTNGAYTLSATVVSGTITFNLRVEDGAYANITGGNTLNLTAAGTIQVTASASDVNANYETPASVTKTITITVPAPTDFIIGSGETKTKTDFDAGNYGNIIIEAGGQFDLGDASLTLNGKVIYKTTVIKEQWYTIGFPFNIDSINSLENEFIEKDWNPLLPFRDTPYSDDYYGDFWLKEYSFADPSFIYTTEALQAGKGYIIQYPDYLDATAINFVSGANPTLNGSNALPVTTNYQLLANPGLKNLTLTQGENNKYYYQLNSAGTAFEKAAASTVLTIAPFESIIAIQTDNPSILRSAFYIDGVTGILVPREDATTDPVVATHYYTLDGKKIARPLADGIYIVRNQLQSGKVQATKVIYKIK
jgi:hypothetical protein